MIDRSISGSIGKVGGSREAEELGSGGDELAESRSRGACTESRREEPALVAKAYVILLTGEDKSESEFCGALCFPLSIGESEESKSELRVRFRERDREREEVRSWSVLGRTNLVA